MYRKYFNVQFWQDVDNLQKEMNRLFGSIAPNRNHGVSAYPAMNVWVNDEEALFTAEVPGVNLDDLDISVVGDTLTIKGTRKQEDVPEGACCYRQERGVGGFSRSVELPFKVNADKVEAIFQKGVLKITLPRAEEDKPRKVSVKPH